MSKNYVAIMAGGIGSRFWPGSRESRPKQFLDILGVGKSLIRLTFERFLEVCPKENIFIVTNKMYKDLVKEHLPELTDNQILCEPSRNNTAPCVAYTCFKLEGLEPDANIIIAPSDHIILDQPGFVKTVNQGLDFVAQNEALLTLGIQPTHPNTGYGYIKFDSENENGVHKVVAFTEKPNLETAEAFVNEGTYLWNGGIFIWNAKTILKSFQINAPEIYDILEKGKLAYNTAEEQNFIDEAYPTTPSISVDYAIMEKADNVYTIPSSFGWSDLGTWGSLFIESEKDENNNAINGNEIQIEDVQNCLIRMPKDKLLVAKGLDDYIIIDEEDVLLIYPKSKEQEIKKVVGEVGKNGGERFL
jgi:mannose-1-phosphate guanylyltransferase